MQALLPVLVWEEARSAALLTGLAPAAALRDQLQDMALRCSCTCCLTDAFQRRKENRKEHARRPPFVPSALLPRPPQPPACPAAARRPPAPRPGCAASGRPARSPTPARRTHVRVVAVCMLTSCMQQIRTSQEVHARAVGHAHLGFASLLLVRCLQPLETLLGLVQAIVQAAHLLQEVAKTC